MTLTAFKRFLRKAPVTRGTFTRPSRQVFRLRRCSLVSHHLERTLSPLPGGCQWVMDCKAVPGTALGPSEKALRHHGDGFAGESHPCSCVRLRDLPQTPGAPTGIMIPQRMKLVNRNQSIQKASLNRCFPIPFQHGSCLSSCCFPSGVKNAAAFAGDNSLLQCPAQGGPCVFACLAAV